VVDVDCGSNSDVAIMIPLFKNCSMVTGYGNVSTAATDFSAEFASVAIGIGPHTTTMQPTSARRPFQLG